MRYTAWMATALLALAAGMGCQTTPTNPKADEAPALTTLGQQTFTAVLSGDPVFLEPLTLWGVPEAELTRAISEVYLTDARTHLRQLKAVPTAQRTATHLETIKFYQTFIRDPEPQLARLTPAIHVEAARIQTNHVALLQTLPASRTPKTAPNIIVRGVDTQSALPEAAVEVLFAVGDRNYSLQLNTCVKLPGIGWRVAEDLTLVDLSARAKAAKTWMEDFPAAQVKARDEKKKLLEEKKKLEAKTNHYEEVASALQTELKDGKIALRRLQNGVVLELPNAVLFPSGKAELNEAGLDTLKSVGEAIKSLKDRRIRIEGHTDSVPVGSNSDFASNWELSSARALAVTRYLQDLGVDPSRMSAEARSQYAPAATNASKTGRARNRRIEIYLVPLPAGVAAKFKTDD